jgi:hypothetical protein
VKIIRLFLKGMAAVCFVIAALLFWAGGRAIHEFCNVDRILSEFLGLGLAGIFAVFGLGMKNASDTNHGE